LKAPRPSTVRITEIADVLGVSYQRASVIANNDPTFPKPVARQGRSHLWKRREVMAWAKWWRREQPWR